MDLRRENSKRVGGDSQIAAAAERGPRGTNIKPAPKFLPKPEAPAIGVQYPIVASW
jgi:hypothetical protein